MFGKKQPSILKLSDIAFEAMRLIEKLAAHKKVAFRFDKWNPPILEFRDYFHVLDPSQRMSCLAWIDGDDLMITVHYTRDAIGGWQEAECRSFGVVQDFGMSMDAFSDQVLTPAVCQLIAQIP